MNDNTLKCSARKCNNGFDLVPYFGDALCFAILPLPSTMPKPSPRPKKAAAKKIESPKNGAAKKPSLKKKNGSPDSSTPRLRESPLPVDQSAHKFVLQPFSPAAPEPEMPAFESLGELPESYGTRRLFLAARDPRWLYAYWDFSWQQIRDAEQESPEGKVFLQIFIPGSERVHQIQVFPDPHPNRE